jgi:hypothetical protein
VALNGTTTVFTVPEKIFRFLVHDFEIFPSEYARSETKWRKVARYINVWHYYSFSSSHPIQARAAHAKRAEARFFQLFRSALRTEEGRA